MISRRTALAAALLAVLTALSGCAALPGARSAPDALEGDGPIVAFYGESYTLGTGASDLSLRWSTQIAVSRGWREFNPSVNGLGFVTNRQSFAGDDLPAQIIAQNPDIVFVTMGLNDNFSYDFAADQIVQQIDADFERLTTGLPDARFIVVEPFWYTAERPESVEMIIEWVREAAHKYGADYIAGASTWIEGQTGLMASDGLHPNDEGYAIMARLMDEALGDLGL